MAQIGCWGDVVFEVSREKIKTFDGLTWETGAKYSTHDRHLGTPLVEFTGNELETMQFSMKFSVFLGVNPIEEIAKMLQAMRKGEAHTLIIGPKAYGQHKWVITKLSNQLERFNNAGELLAATVDVTMQAYNSR